MFGIIITSGRAGTGGRGHTGGRAALAGFLYHGESRLFSFTLILRGKIHTPVIMLKNTQHLLFLKGPVTSLVKKGKMFFSNKSSTELLLLLFIVQLKIHTNVDIRVINKQCRGK